MVALDPNTWTNDDVRSVRTGHEYLLGSPDELNPGPLFIGYDPHRVASQVNLKKESMAYGQGNIAGYRQRAWLVWWALKELWMSGEIGLELGAAGVKTPWCLSTDSQTGRRSYYPKEKPEEDREVVQGHLRVSVDAVLNEYFVHLVDKTGQEYLALTQMVEDPQYLQQPYVKTYQYKKQRDASGWNPA